MINKLIKRLREMTKMVELSYLQTKEIEWAHVYHDSIRGKGELENLSLNIGRWAGNYAFFYILNRIMSDYKPKSILEFGLGESSKIVATYLDNFLLESNHTIIEHDEKWRNFFLNQFKLSNRSNIKILDIVKLEVNGFEYNSYNQIETIIIKKYDLYIIDGPFGSEHYSRYDIVNLSKKLSDKDEFIIIIDDYDRNGEKETSIELLKLFKSRNINVCSKVYVGNKSILVIATMKYKYATSL